MVFTSPNYYVFKKQPVFEKKLFFLAKKVNGPLTFGSLELPTAKSLMRVGCAATVQK